MLLKSKCRKRVIFEEKNSVGEWIKKAREKKGLTQQQLADKSGFKKRAIAYWEKGQRSITIDSRS